MKVNCLSKRLIFILSLKEIRSACILSLFLIKRSRSITRFYWQVFTNLGAVKRYAAFRIDLYQPLQVQRFQEFFYYLLQRSNTLSSIATLKAETFANFAKVYAFGNFESLYSRKFVLTKYFNFLHSQKFMPIFFPMKTKKRDHILYLFCLF